MSKITAPMIEVELDRTRYLRFDFNAAAKFEQVTGKSLFNTNVLNNMSATDIRALLWACLSHEDKELTVEGVGAMLHFGNITELSAKLAQVYAQNTPEADGDNPLAQ